MANKWLAALAAVLLCGCGGLEMAATVTEVFYPQQEATYDKLTGAYTCTRSYQVTEHNPMRTSTDSAISFEVEGGDGPIPPFDTTFFIPHVEDNNIAIEMVPVARRARKLTNDPNNDANPITEVIVDYEGHYIGEGMYVVGVLYEEPDMGTGSEKAYYDRNGDPIGAKGEGELPVGTTKAIPQTIHRVFVNIRSSLFEFYAEVCQHNVGRVNEAGWTPESIKIVKAITSGTGIALEGQFLYLGAQWKANRDGTFTIIHSFSMDFTNKHRTKWHYSKGATKTPAGGSTHVVSVQDGATQYNPVYSVGTFENFLL